MARSVKYLWAGVSTLAKGRIEVPVLDGTAIGVSLLRNDINTAGSIMFLLGIGEILTFALNYKIKYNEDNKLIEQIDEYLDDTFMLFSSYGINAQDLQKWRKSGNRLFRCFVNATRANPVSLSC